MSTSDPYVGILCIFSFSALFINAGGVHIKTFHDTHRPTSFPSPYHLSPLVKARGKYFHLVLKELRNPGHMSALRKSEIYCRIVDIIFTTHSQPLLRVNILDLFQRNIYFLCFPDTLHWSVIDLK